jgi:transcriptional regulator with XRE-family HTH domain
MNIVDLLERARTKLGVKSDRALCRETGIAHQRYLNYRRGIAHPNEETMLRLCATAGVSDDEGLLLLNMWRSKGRAATIYRRLWQELRPTDASGAQVKAKTRSHREQIPA